MEDAVLLESRCAGARRVSNDAGFINGAVHGRGGAIGRARWRSRGIDGVVARKRWRPDGVTRTGNGAGVTREFDALLHRLPLFLLGFRPLDLLGAFVPLFRYLIMRAPVQKRFGEGAEQVQCRFGSKCEMEDGQTERERS